MSFIIFGDWLKRGPKALLVSSMRTLPWNANLQAVFGHHWPYLLAHSHPRSSVPFLRVITPAVERLGLSVTLTDVCKSMGAFEESSSFVLLDSASHQGRFSVVGCLSPSSLRITYRVSDHFVSLARDRSLRKSNPTPHSAYLRLHPSTLLSSSWERFLSFSQPPETVCQLRPIKGMVRKTQNVTRAIAEQSLVGKSKRGCRKSYDC
jgi:hypothetical protein